MLVIAVNGKEACPIHCEEQPTERRGLIKAISVFRHIGYQGLGSPQEFSMATYNYNWPDLIEIQSMLLATDATESLRLVATRRTKMVQF